MPMGFFGYTPDEITEFFEIAEEHKEIHALYLKYVLKWRWFASFFGAFILSALLDPIIIRTIYGGSFLKYFVSLFITYSVAISVLSGDWYHVIMLFNFSKNKKLKIKAAMNVIVTSLIQSTLNIAFLTLFVIVLRYNLMQLMLTINDRYNVPLEMFNGIFKNVPFVILHYLLLETT
ncbi:hypothetical protein [Fervidobacterium thailandense]|uniref:Uncharacterized protein n=1 Tax=Fervidobacterium thailandense TaxID=1008305 RepID=A0A1E3G1Q0_9BACT|nr:hypothetical protein [Fervidobacterium thailandense]ODN30194.1 hypothetical protein A4H02_06425 [Fervidobacterium thailandense]